MNRPEWPRPPLRHYYARTIALLAPAVQRLFTLDRHEQASQLNPSRLRQKDAAGLKKKSSERKKKLARHREVR